MCSCLTEVHVLIYHKVNNLSGAGVKCHSGLPSLTSQGQRLIGTTIERCQIRLSLILSHVEEEGQGFFFLGGGGVGVG